MNPLRSRTRIRTAWRISVVRLGATGRSRPKVGSCCRECGSLPVTEVAAVSAESCVAGG